MSDNRGRHNKDRGRNSVKIPGKPNFTPEGDRLRRQWQKLSDAERRQWGYIFDNYREAHKS